MKKRMILAAAAVLLMLTAGCSALSFLANAVNPDTQGSKAPLPSGGAASLRIAIDPGHGGIDSGATGEDTGISEAVLNLEIGKLLSDKFRQAGADTVMTRESADVDYDADGDTMKLRDMNKRAGLVNDYGPHALVSVHMNTFSDRSVHGAQVFFQQGSAEGKKLAQCIQEALNDGVNDTKKRSVQSGDYFMLRETECPGVIVECGFLSNHDDEKNLQDPEYRDKIAECIYHGVCAYLGVE